VWPRAIALKAKHVLEHPAVGVASTIAHEGTHVRIRRRGIRTTDTNRWRIEHRCAREQIDCLRRIAAAFPELAADAEYYIAHMEQDLRSPTPWYEPSQKWARIRTVLVEYGASARTLWLFDALRPERVAEPRTRTDPDPCSSASSSPSATRCHTRARASSRPYGT
jgi:hypothetical protein